MRFGIFTGEEGILEEVGRRLAQHRLNQNLSQKALAEKASTSLRTIQRLEKGYGGTHLSALIRVCMILGLSGRLEAMFPDHVESPIELLKRQGKRRKRASNKKSISPTKWQWEK